jgi:hypothetical protein
LYLEKKCEKKVFSIPYQHVKERKEGNENKRKKMKIK